MSSDNQHCGFAALIGKPNVGKSTLINALLDEKISIVSRKPQTTRHRILGIYTRANRQIVFIDTPGIHSTEKKALNRYMNKAARSAIADADVMLHMIEAGRWTEEDASIAKLTQDHKRQALLVVNKIDRLTQAELLAFLTQCGQYTQYAAIVPVSALKKDNIGHLLSVVAERLPESPFYYPVEQVTDKSESFFVAELIREKLLLLLNKEVPYSLSVEIEKYEQGDTLDRIHAVIWIERESQKSIVIGTNGQNLKKTGTAVRKELEQRAGKKYYLELWVKVKENWADDERALKSLGYQDLG